MYAAGHLLGRFELLEPLGSGGHGSVWRAKDTLLDEEVALKVLHPEAVSDDEARARLKREVLLARRVQHPRVCRVNDLHAIDGTFVASMQLIRGQTLDDLLQQGPLTTSRALMIIDGLCEGVAAAHACSVVHRDLKPSNVAIDAEGKPVILDFGIARAPGQSRLTQPGIVVGTLRYVAPESLQPASPAQSPDDARADQYALGVIAWALLAGEAPYGQPLSPIELLRAIERGARDLTSMNPEVPRAVADAVHRAMARDPADRHASVEAFRHALLLAMGETSGRFQQSRQTAQGTQVVRHRQRPGFDGPSLTKSTVSGVGPPARRRSSTSLPAPSTTKAPWVGVGIAAGVSLLVVAGILALVWREQRTSATSPTPSVSASAASTPGPMSTRPLAGGAAEAIAVAPDAEQKDDIQTGGGDVRGDVRGDVNDAVDRDGGTASPAQQALAAARAELIRAASKQRGLGLRRGDVPELDTALASGWTALRDNNARAAAAAAARASELIGKVQIDHAFVQAKLRRFNAAADRAIAAKPALKTELRPAASDVGRAMTARDYVAANKALNAAFAVIEGKR